MYRVLLADDEPIERMLVAQTITTCLGAEVEVDQAENGRQAVALFKKSPYQIVILDVEMPGINGLEAAETIRGLDKQCSIIFLTAFDSFPYAKKAITIKALEYLLKPSSEEELIAVLEEAVRLANKMPKEMTFSEQNEKLEQIRMNSLRVNSINFIETHYNEDISLQDVANLMNYTDVYFCKLFKQCFNKSFTTYLSEFRMEKAKILLADVTINIKEISDRVGYRDSNYFAKVFKRMTGVTPSEYRIMISETHL